AAHAGPGAAAERARVVGFADVAFVAAKGDRLRKHAFVGHAVTQCIVDPMAMPPARLYMPPAGALAQKNAPSEWGGLAKKRAPLSQDTCGARPCRSGPDPRNRWSCRRAA